MFKVGSQCCIIARVYNGLARYSLGRIESFRLNLTLRRGVEGSACDCTHRSPLNVATM